MANKKGTEKAAKNTDKKIKKVKSEDQKALKGGRMAADAPRYSGC